MSADNLLCSVRRLYLEFAALNFQGEVGEKGDNGVDGSKGEQGRRGNQGDQVTAFQN